MIDVVVKGEVHVVEYLPKLSSASKLTFSVGKKSGLQVEGPSEILECIARALEKLGAKAETKSPYGSWDEKR